MEGKIAEHGGLIFSVEARAQYVRFFRDVSVEARAQYVRFFRDVVDGKPVTVMDPYAN
ncbi:MAG: hypothetical protein RMJ98_00345 [Myxococcales bacterium]|nr:hypothetical protein [Polyangiaceae bacterium]MDW8247736.1 hypothetical protein [Myxococcales bacterium]